MHSPRPSSSKVIASAAAQVGTSKTHVHLSSQPPEVAAGSRCVVSTCTPGCYLLTSSIAEISFIPIITILFFFVIVVFVLLYLSSFLLLPWLELLKYLSTQVN